MPRQIIGHIGPINDPAARKFCSELFAREGIDASFAFYRTSVNDLPLRLSEMFHLERRGYIVAPELQKAIVPLLDSIDNSANERGVVDTVVNEGGVLVGFSREGGTSGSHVERRHLLLWFSVSAD